MGNTVEKVLAVAEAEVGYLEKKSNSQLDNPTANAGKNNYTKYSRDLVEWIGSPYSQGVAWCDQFVDWCFINAFGINEAKRLLGGWSAYTPTSANYFKQMGRWSSKPQVGSVIFFKNSTRICHTGIVYKVDAATVYTIEGNTSTGAGVIANGGGVCKKSYSLNNSKIAGYGHPLYDASTTVSSPLTTTTLIKADFTKIAKEVIAGKWGSGNERKNRLRAAGYDYAAVQAEVNKLLKK